MALDRRDFLKFIIGGAIGTLFTPLPWKLADDISIWTQNWPWIPKVPKGKIYEKPSLAKFDGPEYGVKIKMIKGHPILSCGNEHNWFSEGGIEPIGASLVNLYYSPSRIKKPLKKTSNGKFEEISWNDAKKVLVELIQKSKKDFAVVCGDESGSISELFGVLLSSNNSNSFYFMPTDRISYHKVWKDLFNGHGEIGFDLEKADLVVSFNADFLGSWGCVVKNLKEFSKRRFKLIYVGPYINQTAILAQKRILIKEKDIGKFILCIIYELISKGISPPPEILGFEDFKKFVLTSCNPSKILADIGIKKEDLNYVVKSLLSSKKVLFISGSSANSGGSHVNIFGALCLNILFDRINKDGGLKCIPSSPLVLDSWDQEKAKDNDLAFDLIDKGKTFKLMLFYKANPIYSLPKPLIKAILKVPFKVTFSTIMNETALNSELVIPVPHPFETYEDSFTPFGSWKPSYNISKPIIKNSSIPDVFSFIKEVLKELKIKLKVKDYHGMIKAKSDLLGADFNKLSKGEVWTSNTIEYPLGITLWNKKIESLLKDYLYQQKEEKLSFTPIKDLRFGSSLTGILPYGLSAMREEELYKDKSLLFKIHPFTAKKYGLKEGVRVKVLGDGGEIKGWISVDPSVSIGSIAAFMGFGRLINDDFNRGKGENVSKLFSLKKEEGINGYCWCFPEVEVKKI